MGLLKEAVRKDTKTAGSPLVLWDYATERRAMILSITARDLFRFRGATHIPQLSEKKATFLTSVSLLGMNGYTSTMIILQVSSYFRKQG